MVLATGLSQLESLIPHDGYQIQTIGITFGFAVLSITYFFVRLLFQSRNTFPKVNPDDVTRDLDFTKGRSPEKLKMTAFLQKASKKFSRPFIANFKDVGPTIILPAKYADDIKNEKNMDFDKGFAKDFPVFLPGFEGLRVAQDSHIFHDTIRIKLTQSLSFFTEELSDEAEISLPELFPASDSWQETKIVPAALELVARLSSLIFMGREFDRREEWTEISKSYTVNCFQAARVMRTWNPLLRPVVHWFLPEFRLLRNQVKQAMSIIEPEVRARRLRRQQMDQDGVSSKKSLDSVDWFEDVRKGRDFDFVAGELCMSLVAIHTTSGTLSNAILDICANPELIQPLRDEIKQVLQEDGKLQRTTLHKLKLMDSVMKESQRLHPLGQGSLRRKVMKSMTLHDGTVLPEGSYTLSAPLENFDEQVYDEPFKFDGYRFFNLRQRPGEENKWQFVTTQPEQLGFGHGMHACPGRFFASNELKIALMHMLMKYDWKLPDGEKRYESLELGLETVVNPNAKVMFKARIPEVIF